jgi:hypothetical protein
LVYTATDDKGNETIHMSFSPKEIKRVEQNTQGLLDFLQNEKREKDLDYFFSKNVLPTLQGIFKEELQNYIAEQELATEYHTKSTEGISLLAKHDMQNVLQTYEKSNKITQTMELSLKLDLRAGKLQAGINTQVYRKKIWNIMGGIGFSLFFCIIGFSVNLGIHTIIGVLFLAYNLYELWKVLAQKG